VRERERERERERKRARRYTASTSNSPTAARSENGIVVVPRISRSSVSQSVSRVSPRVVLPFCEKRFSVAAATRFYSAVVCCCARDSTSNTSEIRVRFIMHGGAPDRARRRKKAAAGFLRSVFIRSSDGPLLRWESSSSRSAVRAAAFVARSRAAFTIALSIVRRRDAPRRTASHRIASHRIASHLATQPSTCDEERKSETVRGDEVRCVFCILFFFFCHFSSLFLDLSLVALQWLCFSFGDSFHNAFPMFICVLFSFFEVSMDKRRVNARVLSRLRPQNGVAERDRPSYFFLNLKRTILRDVWGETIFFNQNLGKVFSRLLGTLIYTWNNRFQCWILYLCS